MAQTIKLRDPRALIDQALTKIDVSHTNKSFIGKLMLFEYDPKLAKTLPYWDRFPLVLPLDVKKQTILGVNFHYLPLTVRLRLLQTFKKYVDKKTGNSLNITYPIVKDRDELTAAYVTIHRYLFSHIKSTIVPIAIEDWDMYISSPLSDFQKADTFRVYKDTLDRINK